jgi:hypothetical protein
MIILYILVTNKNPLGSRHMSILGLEMSPTKPIMRYRYDLFVGFKSIVRKKPRCYGIMRKRYVRGGFMKRPRLVYDDNVARSPERHLISSLKVIKTY